MTTTVSPAGKSSPENMRAASPATKVALGIALADALSRAQAMLVSLISTPVTRANAPAALRAKSPLPQ